MRNYDDEILESIDPQEFYQPPRLVTERARKDIALRLVRVFEVAVYAVLAGTFLLAIVVAVVEIAGKESGPVLTNMIGNAMIPYLQTTGALLSSIFGPLLAFILGHYFGERKA